MKKLNKKRGLAALMAVLMGASMFTTTAAIGVSAGGEGAGTSSVSAGSRKTVKQTTQQRKEEEKKPTPHTDLDFINRQVNQEIIIRKHMRMVEDMKEYLDLANGIDGVSEEQHRLIEAMVSYDATDEKFINSEIQTAFVLFISKMLKNGASWTELYHKLRTAVENGINSMNKCVYLLSKGIRDEVISGLSPELILEEFFKNRISGLPDNLLKRVQDKYGDDATLDNIVNEIIFWKSEDFL